MIHHDQRKKSMAKCPTCGKEVKTAKITRRWLQTRQKRKTTQLTIALYVAAVDFREVLDKKKI
jgi:ribosomal protein L34E